MDELQTGNIGTLIEPDPIGFSFDAPGWVILLGLIGVLVLMYLVSRYLKYRRNRYRRTAVALIESFPAMGLSAHQLIFRITETMKRVSVTSYQREEVAHLKGEAWVSYLEERHRANPVFTPRTKEIISRALYQGKKANLSKEDLSGFQRESINWIKKHRV